VARLYANENFPLQAVEELRLLGHDVLTTRQAGNAGQAKPDDRVLAFATGQGRALVTLNRKHFIRLHHFDADHAGIIACTFDANFVALAHRIDAAIAGQPSLAGQLIRVNRPAD
jgi:hypothetical protein